MILADIKAYLMQHQQASLLDIATHFQSSPDAVRGMLEIWIRKGRVIRYQPSSACNSGCNKCNQHQTELYVWEIEKPLQSEKSRLTDCCTQT